MKPKGDRMTKRTWSALAALGMLVAAVPRAGAQGMLTPEARAAQESGEVGESDFGRPGQITIGSTIGFGGFSASTNGASGAGPVFNLSSRSEAGGTSESSLTLGLEGQIGYLVARFLEVGVGLLAGQSSLTRTPPAMGTPTTESTIGFAILPYGRYHIELKRNVFLYVGGAVGYETLQTTTTTGAATGSSSQSGLRLGILGGIELATGHLILALGPEIVYWLASTTDTGTSATPAFNISLTGRIGAYF